MTQTQTDPRTPGRSASVASSLGRADLLRRLGRLSLGAEALPRVLRLLEEEIAQALETSVGDSFTANEIEEVSGDAELVTKLRAHRKDQERVAAIRASGMADLSADDLQALLAESKKGS